MLRVDVSGVYEKADVVVVPQTDASTSGGLVLAMSMSKPVVAAATPHARGFFLVKWSKAAFCTSPEVNGISIARYRKVGRHSELVRMGLANGSRMDGFTWAQMAKTVTDAYRN